MFRGQRLRDVRQTRGRLRVESHLAASVFSEELRDQRVSGLIVRLGTDVCENLLGSLLLTLS